MANWPQNGEIDVMEQVNQNNGNLMTLHTDQGCSMDGVKRLQSGTAAQGDCNEAVNGNAGCGVTGSNSTYGPAFNSQGGGVMAVEWRTEGIRMWQFARSAIPSDITSQNPSPNTWGSALADFPDTGCDVASHFKNQSIIINTDLCGVWAGSPSVYSGSGCEFSNSLKSSPPRPLLVSALTELAAMQARLTAPTLLPTTRPPLPTRTGNLAGSRSITASEPNAWRDNCGTV